MQTEDKMAIFLYIVGEEQAQKIIRILDSGEIRRLLPALQRVTKPSAELQQNILAEFSLLGYQSNAEPGNCVNIFRRLWHDEEKKPKQYIFPC